MTLKQKLKSFAMDNHIEKYAEHNAKELERIADDYAIEFSEWCVDNELFVYLNLVVEDTLMLL